MFDTITFALSYVEALCPSGSGKSVLTRSMISRMVGLIQFLQNSANFKLTESPKNSSNTKWPVHLHGIGDQVRGAMNRTLQSLALLQMHSTRGGWRAYTKDTLTEQASSTIPQSSVIRVGWAGQVVLYNRVV